MLAKIALARHDADAAREEAGLAQAEDPALPLPATSMHGCSTIRASMPTPYRAFWRRSPT